MIINWKPLVMVAKGELYFDEHLSPDLSLNTSSLALTEILDKFNQYSWLEDKGRVCCQDFTQQQIFQEEPD